MTVAELIAKLQKYPSDSEVELVDDWDYCDCMQFNSVGLYEEMLENYPNMDIVKKPRDPNTVLLYDI